MTLLYKPFDSPLDQTYLSYSLFKLEI